MAAGCEDAQIRSTSRNHSQQKTSAFDYCTAEYERARLNATRNQLNTKVFERSGVIPASLQTLNFPHEFMQNPNSHSISAKSSSSFNL